MVIELHNGSTIARLQRPAERDITIENVVTEIVSSVIFAALISVPKSGA